MTRSGREKYLVKTIKSLRTCAVDIMVWANGPMDLSNVGPLVWSHVHEFNAGQHVAHNSMLDECIRLGQYDWHIRVDDDCWIKSRKWLTKLLTAQENLKALIKKYCVMSPKIDGLDHPPEKMRSYEVEGDIVDHVKILGGVFRMSPMYLMRYFRWDERQAMGFGDANQFSNYCEATGTKMMRLCEVIATHGGSTGEQNSKSPSWSTEHDMLQYIPLGL